MQWWCRLSRVDPSFGAGLVVSLGLLAGCGGQSERRSGDDDAGTGGTAGTGGPYGGEAGATFTGGVSGVGGTSGGGGCYYSGRYYEPGQSFRADDGCNTCFCDEGGGVSCTLIDCPTDCFYEERWYPNGSVFPASDGCNSCECNNGVVGCTEIGCPTSCIYQGVVYDDGASFPDANGCGTCTCTSGEMTCGSVPCPPNRCDMLSFWYTERLMFGAKYCNPNIDIPQCLSLMVSWLPCGCPTFVNDSASLASWAAEFSMLGCSGPIACPPCPPPPSSAYCSSQGTCIDVP